MIRKYYDGEATHSGGGSSNQSKKYPIGGYAPGNYSCRCANCKTAFMGDKMAVQCEPCAEKMISEQSSNEEQKEAIPEFFTKWLEEFLPYDIPDGSRYTSSFNALISDKRAIAIAAYRKLKGTEPVLRLPKGMIFMVKWQPAARIFDLLQKYEMKWKPGPMGNDSFYLIDGDQQIEIFPGHWIAVDKDNRFYHFESIPSSLPEKPVPLRWVRVTDRLPRPDKKVYVEWQGIWGEASGILDREEIEEKMRDASVDSIQWLEGESSSLPDGEVNDKG